ncbi:hypothetical protein HO133_004756 [Letharia lupina]|uniref:Uncharacterized protein n=1 Tax=Letharia lupina TaxID=560253 RepID=A0A8H6KZY2_9LECA|nr:uncharacterized protein HO133_004756 [Letharia lupina]KAF6230414.1 hypothetical protein HO133_004756 [Letharia lupina]
MGNVMDAEEGADNHRRPTILIIAENEQNNAGARQSQGEGNPLSRLPVYSFHGDKGVIQPLNAPARNVIAHTRPALIKHAVASAFRRQANKKGLYADTDCVVHWKPSAIPFHIEFEINASNNTCQHLASVRNIKAKDPVSTRPYALLTDLTGTGPIQSDNRSNCTAEDKRTSETIQHACLIKDQHISLTEIDIKTAEATAKMVNAGKIVAGLLVYLTSRKPRIEDVVMSKEPPVTDNKAFQLTERPFPNAPQRPKPLVYADEIQGLGSVLKHKRVVSNPENGIDGVTFIEHSTLGENSVPEDTSALKKTLPAEPAAAITSSKGGKASSSKNNQCGKQIRNKRTRHEAISSVSAYPTQRPPRKKSARKSITTEDSSEGRRPGREECDLSQVSATRSLNLDNGETTPEQNLIAKELSQKALTSPVSASKEHKEPRAHTAKEVLNLEQIALDVIFSPGDIVCCEDLITTADKPIPFSLTTKSIDNNGSGVQGLLWAYAIDTKVDETLEEAGTWLWRRPKTYICTQPLLRMEKFGHSILASVVISHERTENDEPIIENDGSAVHIVPHEQCWDDVRSHKSHPDFLVPEKLVEYQASEAAGYDIWRHDRDLLECRKPDCDAMISDYHHSVVVCLGCGPKSIVRYCSLQHQLEDIEGHWEECGTWEGLLQRVIDHTTAPSKFARMYPAIKQRHGSKNAALHRQMLYCALTYGHYTLFDSASNRSETLCWPKQDPKWPEMDRRVERLLNVAFLDSWNHYVLGYLYRLLRELLRSRGEWSKRTERSLKLQFEAEFSDYKVNTRWHNGEAPCQCEWSGKILPRYDHLSTCGYALVADDYGPVRRQKCIETTVEDYEERFWILRAWRQQHPTQNNWRFRAAGHGFRAMVPDEECYDLGPGWTGWGGEMDNICADQEDHGEKRSMRSA